MNLPGASLLFSPLVRHASIRKRARLDFLLYLYPKSVRDPFTRFKLGLLLSPNHR